MTVALDAVRRHWYALPLRERVEIRVAFARLFASVGEWRAAWRALVGPV